MTTLTPLNPVALRWGSGGAPAVDLTKLRGAGHVDLTKRSEKAGFQLSRRGLGGVRAQGVLVLDHSASMRGDYSSGLVQTLVERALGFVLQIDVDGVIPVVPFDSHAHPTILVGAERGRTPRGEAVEGYHDVVDRHIWKNRGRMGSTNLYDALSRVLEMAEVTTDPMFVTVVTDGAPDHGTRRKTTQLVAHLSRYPVFLKFLGVRDSSYLDDLDGGADMVRLLDNVNTRTFDSLSVITDMLFADAMADEWDLWIRRATAAGVLR